MMNILKGVTDISTYVNLVDSAAGTPETGLTITNIDATYTRMRAAAVKNDLTALAAADSAHADNKGIEVDATNAPGLYRIDWPDAAFATGADKVILTVTCSGCAPAHVHVNLVNYNNQDGVRLGLTALPNAAADAAGGLIISDAGGLDADAQRSDVAAILVDTGTTLDARLPAALVSGRIDASVGAMAAGTITAAAIATGAVDADAIAADAVTEIQSGLATAAALDTVDNFLDTEIAAIVSAVAAIETDTQDIQGRLPAALVSGRIDASVGAMAANVMTAAAAAADLTTELQSGLATAADLATVAGYIDTEVAAIKAKTDLIPGSQDGKTFAETILLMACVLLGKSSGMATATNIFRALNDSKDRVTATTDENGNRTAITLDAS